MKIGNETPINKTAAIVMSKGVSYEFKGSCDVISTRNPLEMRGCPADIQNLSGSVSGKLTVIGLADHYRLRWVVRCSCGNYEHRRSKAIINQKNNVDRCIDCAKLITSKQYFHKETTGVNLSREEIIKKNGI